MTGVPIPPPPPPHVRQRVIQAHADLLDAMLAADLALVQGCDLATAYRHKRDTRIRLDLLDLARCDRTGLGAALRRYIDSDEAAVVRRQSDGIAEVRRVMRAAHEMIGQGLDAIEAEQVDANERRQLRAAIADEDGTA